MWAVQLPSYLQIHCTNIQTSSRTKSVSLHPLITLLLISRVHRPVLWAVIEGRGRRPSHTFLDYALTYLITSVVLAFTLGQVCHYISHIPHTLPFYESQLQELKPQSFWIWEEILGLILRLKILKPSVLQYGISEWRMNQIALAWHQYYAVFWLQIGGPKQGRPNFVDQLGQSNGPLVAFALAGGMSLAVGDVCMMFSVALLGLAVGPAAVNALSIIVGEFRLSLTVPSLW